MQKATTKKSSIKLSFLDLKKHGSEHMLRIETPNFTNIKIKPILDEENRHWNLLVLHREKKMLERIKQNDMKKGLDVKTWLQYYKILLKEYIPIPLNQMNFRLS